MRLTVDQSLATDFIPINTPQQTASLPFKPGQGHHLQVKMGSLSATEDLRRYITMTICHSIPYINVFQAPL